MSLSRPVAPNLPTSDVAYPGMAEVREHEGRRTFSYVDFGWIEDAVAAWRAVAVLGGLLFVEGLLFWLGATGYEGFTMGPLIAIGAILFFGCAIAAFLGFAETALAMFGALVVAILLVLLDPPLPIASASSLFSDPSAVVPDQVTVVILWVIGALLLGLGVVQAVRAAREDDSDE